MKSGNCCRKPTVESRQAERRRPPKPITTAATIGVAAWNRVSVNCSRSRRPPLCRRCRTERFPMGEGEPIRRTVTLTVAQGLHLTPISVLVRRAGNFSSRILLSFDGRTADARSVYDLMLLAAPCGAILTIEAQGQDATLAVAEIEKLFAEGFRIPPTAENS